MASIKNNFNHDELRQKKNLEKNISQGKHIFYRTLYALKDMANCQNQEFLISYIRHSVILVFLTACTELVYNSLPQVEFRIQFKYQLSQLPYLSKMYGILIFLYIR